MPDELPHADLRAWAEGMYTAEAATELLIRAFDGTMADPSRPWIRTSNRGHWVDFDSIPDHLGALSGGEQRLLRIAASIGSSCTPAINLGDEISGLNRPTLRLVLAALAHAGGNHEHPDVIVDFNGQATMVRLRNLPGVARRGSVPRVPEDRRRWAASMNG